MCVPLRDRLTAMGVWHCVVQFGCGLLAIAIALLPSAGLAQSPPWDVMRVFIQDDQESITKIVTSAYSDVDPQWLEKRLADEVQRRRQLAIDGPALRESTYIVSMLDDRLVSEQSLWSLTSTPTSQNVVLGKMSVAPTGARIQPAEHRQLVDFDTYTDSGDIRVHVDSDATQYVFGFSTLGTKVGVQRRFSFRFPAAPISKMLVHLPNALSLESDSATVQSVAAPTSYVTDSASLEAITSMGGPPSTWWLVMASGLSEFDLVVRPRTSNSAGQFTHLVRSAKIDYSIAKSVTRFNASFELAPGTGGLPIRICLHPSVRISQVDINGSKADWRRAGETANRWQIIEPNAVSSRDASTSITLKGLARVDTSQEAPLPGLHIENAYVIQGETSLQCGENLILVGVTRQAESSNSSAAVPSPDLGQSTGNSWAIPWMGKPPGLLAQLANRKSDWHVQSLTRISIQPDWLSATCRARVRVPLALDNEIRFRIGQQWVVDSARIIQPAGGTLETRLVAATESEPASLVVKWDRTPQELSFEFELRAHSSRAAAQGRIELGKENLLWLPGADQVDACAIEPVGPFRIVASETLLRLQKPRSELPDWQQELLPESPNQWLLHGQSGQLPTVKLSAFGGTFVANLLTALVPDETGFIVTTAVRCEPISGAVDGLDLELPGDLIPEQITWSLQLPNRLGGEFRLGAGEIRRGPGETWRVGLTFPEPMQEPFRVHASWPATIDADGTFAAAIPAVPRALSGSSKVLIPRSIAPPEGDLMLEIMPATACCDGSEFDSVLLGLSDTVRRSYVAGNLDASSPHALVFRKRGAQQRPQSWIQNETIVHWLYDGESHAHSASWEIQSSAQSNVQIQLPSGWEVQRVEMDGRSIDLRPSIDGLLRLDLKSAGRRNLSVFCTEKSVPHWLVSRHRLPSPKLSVPVLQRSVTAKLPPTQISLLNLAPANPGGSILDRLNPHSLWHWLSPLQSSHGRRPENSRGAWTHVNLSPRSRTETRAGSFDVHSSPEVSQVFTMNRSTLAALSIALLGLWIGFLRLLNIQAPHVWLLGVAGSGILVVLCPDAFLPLPQLILLGTLCAWMLHLAKPIYRYRGGQSTAAPKSNSRSLLQGGIDSGKIVGCIALLCCGVAPAVAFGQPEQGKISSADKLESETDAYKIYGLLIPVDDESKFTGSKVYIPTELLDRLANPEHNNAILGSAGIVSADYRLRISRSTLTPGGFTSDIELDLVVDFPTSASLIRLPFDAARLELFEGRIDDEIAAADGRLVRDETDGSITIRPGVAGRLPIQLQFSEIAITDSPGQMRLVCDVPTIPNATLRVSSDSLLEFNVDSQGAVKHETAGLFSRIGPVSQLRLTWNSPNDRAATLAQPLTLKSKTWVHADPTGLAAVCHVHLQGDLPTDREIKLVVDSNWVPVGDHWGDGMTVDSSPLALGTQTRYVVRLTDEAAGGLTADLRILFTPRSSTRAGSIRVPFLALQGTTSADRTLVWTADADANWKPEGLALWQASQAGNLESWGDMKLSNSQQLVFRSVRDIGVPVLRRQAPGVSRRQNSQEVTRVHLSANEIRIEFSAALSDPRPGGNRPATGNGLAAVSDAKANVRNALRLRIPSNSRVGRVRVNGMPSTEYRVGANAEGEFLVIDRGKSGGSIHNTDVVLYQSLQLDKPTPLPRVVLESVKATSSTYTLVRSTAIQCELTGDAFSLIPFEGRLTDQLEKSESTVGAAQLLANFRESVELPVQFRVYDRQQPPNMRSALVIDADAGLWRGRFLAVWDNLTEPLDVVSFQIPAGLRDSVSMGQIPRRFAPTGDPSRLMMVMVPPKPVDGSVRIEFEIPLQSSQSSRTVSVPEILVLSDEITHPTLAVPNAIAGQSVRWTKVGERAEVPSELWADADEDSHLFFEMGEGNTQPAWQAVDASAGGNLLVYRGLELQSRMGNTLSGKATYWIEPNGELSFDLLLPSGCRILGVENDHQNLDWRQSENTASILLQPNYLPMNLSVVLQWQFDDPRQVELSLPQPTARGAAGTFVRNGLDRLVFESALRSQPAPGETASQFSSSRGWQDILADKWAQVITNVLPKLLSMPSPDVEGWLSGWHPTLVGLPPEAMIQSPSVLAAGASSLPSPVTVQQFWEMTCIKLGVSETLTEFNTSQQSIGRPLDWLPANQQRGFLDPAQRLQRQLLIGADRVTLVLPPADESWFSRGTAAGILAAIAGLVFIALRRAGARYTSLMNHNPWIYWLQMSVLAFVLLPVAWPAAVILLLAISLLLSQWLDQRKRNRTILRV